MEIISEEIVNGKRIVHARYTDEEKAAMAKAAEEAEAKAKEAEAKKEAENAEL